MVTPPRLRAVLLALGLAVVGGGCGNAVSADIIGTTALTVDGRGAPVVLVAVCDQHVDTIEIYTGREGLEDDEPNPSVASWTSSSPQTGTVTLALDRVSAAWTGPGAVRLADDTLYIVSASRSDADAETTQVSFRGRAIAALGPDQVIVRDGRVWTRERFDAQACVTE
ncbi:hypothetical protein [Nocardioides sp.]|uniref:hypothetical protein n=1 Tax=Nocardioides sp. TaxID=35761 RepID=UPI003D1139F9